MISKLEALEIVRAQLAKESTESPTDLVVLEDRTIERTWGWVFFYDSKRHLETQDFRDALAGNAPIFVNRDTGALSVTGTGRPIEFYIREYERRIRRSSRD